MDLLDELGVSKLPTFKVWVNGEMVDTILGEKLDDLELSIQDAIDEYTETHSGETEASTED